VRRSREEQIKNSGRYGLKIEYKTETGKGKDYVAVCRVHPWNMAGTDAVRFWLKPDGSGRHLTFEMNIADVSEIAFYIGVSEGRYGDGVFYIDDIQAVRLEDGNEIPIRFILRVL
jgi:hypothetical protein